MRHGVIIGTGSYTPPHVMTNDDLAGMVDTSDEWISSRTGIKERRISAGESTSDLAYEASLRALKVSGLSPEELDLIICATITPDYFMPSVACTVQDRLGAGNAAAFDLSAACTGFIYAMVTAEQFISTGMYNNVLVIGAETISRILDWDDRSTCVLFGDGAGAMILSAAEGPGHILGSVLTSDGGKQDYLTCPAVSLVNPYTGDSNAKFDPHIKMQGQEVFKYAVRAITDCIDRVLNKAGLSLQDIKYILPHQANKRIIEQAAKFSNSPFEKFYLNLEDYGNTSAASIGIALDEMIREGLLIRGDKIILVGFGGGLTSGAVLLEY